MEARGREGIAALSMRLKTLADMVTPGNRLVDVGCDHGFLSIYLVQTGICPRAIAMDVRSGPLAGARRHVEEYGLGDYIDLRLSDGLQACRAGEADTLVCAGMGGRLMERILAEGMDRAAKLREVILQPQSEIPRFRAFLRGAGFRVTAESAVCEEGKYYFAMKAQPVHAPAQRAADSGPEQELYDLYGELLLKQRHPVLFAYLRQRREYLEWLAVSLGEAGSSRADGRLGEVRRELAQTKRALSYYG